MMLAAKVAGFFAAPPAGVWSRYLPALGWAALIFILSEIPGNCYPKVNMPNADKGVHAALFLPLGWFLARSFMGAGPACISKLATAALAGALYGLSDEVHQIWVPLRAFSWADWAVDCAASAVGTALWAFAGRPLFAAIGGVGSRAKVDDEGSAAAPKTLAENASACPSTSLRE